VHVTLDSERCVSSGARMMLASTVFDQDDDGVPLLLKENIEDVELASLEESVRIHPSARPVRQRVAVAGNGTRELMAALSGN
jgi:ferredoxin